MLNLTRGNVLKKITSSVMDHVVENKAEKGREVREGVDKVSFNDVDKSPCQRTRHIDRNVFVHNVGKKKKCLCKN